MAKLNIIESALQSIGANPVPPPPIPKDLRAHVREGYKPWDRLEKETDGAWSAFQEYRDIGPDVRNFGVIASDVGRNIKCIRLWATKYMWRHRVALWDAHLDELRQKAYEDEIKLMSERHARSGQALQRLGNQRIEQFAERKELQETLTARDALALLDTGIKIEREAVSASKEKEQRGGNITFNITLAGRPKWAPQVPATPVTVGYLPAEVVKENVAPIPDYRPKLVKDIRGEVIRGEMNGDISQEAAPPSATEGD